MMRTTSRRHYLVGLFALTGILGLGSCNDPTGPLRDSRGVLLVLRGTYGTYAPESEIFAVRPDGSEMRRLTTNAVFDTDPAWSPDGTRIAFVSVRDSIAGAPNRRPGIFVMNGDGSQVRRLFQSSIAAWHPRWSPDGRRIVFENYDPAIGKFRVHIMNADGSNVRQVPATDGDNFSPEWSPDGTRISFLSNRSPRLLWMIYMVNADGTGERQVSDDSACARNVTWIRWSPDGSRIAYTCDAEPGRIYTVQTDGTDKRLLIPHPTGTTWYDFRPVWSHDGTQVAFTSNRANMNASYQVFVASASGDNIKRVTMDSAAYAIADWGPPR